MDCIKTKVVDYWEQRVDTFSSQRLKEFNSEKKDLWLNEFKKYIPMDRSLKVLDVGTGTGFFSFMLAGEGHKVTGIDLTEGMIEEARRTSENIGIKAEFYVMDAEEPNFEPNSFDVIVSRNLTWTLPQLDKAYKSWNNLLKPDGILINFDADYCHEDSNREIPENHAHKQIATELMDQYEKIKETLKQKQKMRPQWDKDLLLQAGFKEIFIDETVWKRVYKDFDEFYNPTPIFTIVAYA